MANLQEYFEDGENVDQNMLDFYANHPELLESMMKEYEDMQRNYSVYNECVVPVLTQSYDSMSHIIILCLLLRFVSLLKVPSQIINAVSAVFGIYVLWQFYEKSIAYVLLPVVIIVVFYQFEKSGGGFQLSIAALIYFVLCEFYLDPMIWNKVKGSVMIVFMKIISVAFEQESLSLIEVCGYLLNPASIIFGPFLTYGDFKQLFAPNSSNFRWLFSSLQALILSAVCLLWSSCGIQHFLSMVPTYVPLIEGNKWWNAYKDAQSFRFSHYFISYFSTSLCLIMGIGVFEKKQLNEKEEKSDEIKKEEKVFYWKRPVANIIPVEFPRSLVDVVTNWNLPMHFWLKQYVFKQSRKFGVFAAILLTYIASSLLHGLNFQLSSVLLSIGLFAYIESVVRHTLASIFSACIEARQCKSACHHTYKKSNFVVMSVNLLLAFIAVWNLAYLGCLFDNSNEQEQGYSMNHVMTKWKDYQFINHIFMFLSYIISRLINYGSLY